MKVNHPQPIIDQPWYKEVLGSLKNKDTERLNDNQGETVVGENIYQEPGTKQQEIVKKYHFFHYIIKYKIYLPLLVILERFTDRHLRNEVSPTVYNRNLRVFNDAWEESIVEWERHFMSPRDKEFFKKPRDTMERHSKEDILKGPARRLRTIKALQLTLALEDTAYRPFYDILMFKIAQRMHDEYQHLDGRPTKYTFYTNRGIADPVYFLIWQRFNAEEHKAEVVVESTESILKNDCSAKKEGMGL